MIIFISIGLFVIISLWIFLYNRRGEYMNLNEIKVFLEENFNKPALEGKNRHIVFWYDSECDFIDDIDSLDLKNVKVL